MINNSANFSGGVIFLDESNELIYSNNNSTNSFSFSQAGKIYFVKIF